MDKFWIVCHPIGTLLAKLPEGANLVTMFGTASELTEVTEKTYYMLMAEGLKVYPIE